MSGIESDPFFVHINRIYYNEHSYSLVFLKKYHLRQNCLFVFGKFQNYQFFEKKNTLLIILFAKKRKTFT